MKLKQIIFLIIGCLSLALGCVGIVLPILPTVPFFLLTVSASRTPHRSCTTGSSGRRCTKSTSNRLCRKRA